jgi:hypothetical protein
VTATAAVLLAGLLLLGGCAHTDGGLIAVPPSTPAVSTAPVGGELLTQIGIKQGPDGFSIPKDLPVNYHVDQSNTVSIVTTVSGGDELVGYLRDNLAAMGFTITGDANESLTFTAPGWTGAVTVSDKVGVLDLTRQ